MAVFKVRAWMEQKLYDCEDYEVEAGSFEEAAAILEGLSRSGGAFPQDARVKRAAGGGWFLRELDPQEVVDGDAGFVLLDEDGDPDLANSPSM